MRVNNDQLSAVIGVATGLFVVHHALTYKIGSLASPQLGFFPLVSGIAIVGFSAFGLAIASWQANSGQGWQPLLKDGDWRRPLVVVVLLLAYAALFETLGFPITTFLFLLLLLLIVERVAPIHAAIVSLTITASAYALFAVLLRVQFPKGALGF